MNIDQLGNNTWKTHDEGISKPSPQHMSDVGHHVQRSAILPHCESDWPTGVVSVVDEDKLIKSGVCDDV